MAINSYIYTRVHMHIAYNLKFIDNTVMNFWGLYYIQYTTKLKRLGA